MFRLVNIVDDRLQQIISKELMNGFENMFDLKINDLEHSLTQIEDFCADIQLPTDNKLQHNLAVYKIIGMYKELYDPDFKYTFDEEGAYILSQILQQQLSIFEDFMHCDRLDSWTIEESESIESSIKAFWDSSLSDDDISYVKDYADIYFEIIKKEVLEESFFSRTCYRRNKYSVLLYTFYHFIHCFIIQYTKRMIFKCI